METLLLPGMDGTGKLFASLERHLAPALCTRVVAFPPDQPRSYDQLLGAGVMAQMKRLRSDMKTHVLDAPHQVLQRKPVEAAQLISEFLLSKRP